MEAKENLGCGRKYSISKKLKMFDNYFDPCSLSDTPNENGLGGRL